ncbi:alpha-tocopherol transfer protein [Drosophila grimshawi]|uniref:GH14848 n=1 Tax=Drosophila grimshawi TaxID=7222 RepID=B4J2M4_DROGR|nr:alpha-tocopherol transfer protein [Drosophila grimshawi]EDV97109.1 GH14848 [Drosophila grimshawi]
MPEIRPLSASLQRTAIEELNEVPDRLDADIATLRTWIKQQPHLRSRSDDQFLVAFLRGCKFSLEKAKAKLDKYYTLRTLYPEFYTISDVDSKRTHELLRLGVALRLPIPLHDNGPRIIYVRPGCYAADKYSFEEIIAIGHGLTGITLYNDDYAVIHGFLFVLDFSNYTPAHMVQMTPSTAKKMSVFGQDAMPVRDKGRHMINTNAVFELSFNAIRSILPTKEQNRISVHGSNLESLYAHIPQKYLPAHLGGEQGTIEELIQHHLNVFTEHREFLIDETNYGVDEKLRPAGQQYDYNSIFGVDGSFRKLNFD